MVFMAAIGTDNEFSINDVNRFEIPEAVGCSTDSAALQLNECEHSGRMARSIF